MNRYLLEADCFPRDWFKAETDKDAELYVEENYSEEDGRMVLYRLNPLTTWGE